MSNLQNTVRLPIRTTMTNKWKSPALNNDLLERKTRALEGSLNKLKLTTQRDQTKSTIETNRRAKEPRAKPTVKPSSTKCGQCEKDVAKMKCLECIEFYCASCFSRFHLRGALQRHHCILLSTSSPKKIQSSSSDIDLRETNVNQSTGLGNEKSNHLSFQQSFLQWRDDNIDKSIRIRQRRGLTSPTNDRIEHSNRLPHIEFNSSKTTSDENLFAYKSPSVYQESFIQQSKKTNMTRKNQQKIGGLFDPRYSLSENDPVIDIAPLNDNSTTTTQVGECTEIIPEEENLNTEHNLAQERPITHVSNKSLSRPTSPLIKKDSISSRPNSLTRFQQSLRSTLATKSTDELEAIIGSQLILSRPSSSTSEKLDQPSNEILSQIRSNTIDDQSTVIDQNPIPPFDSALEHLLENLPPMLSGKDQSSTHVFCLNSTTSTPGRNSPFSFSNSIYKTGRIHSSSSRDTCDGGFFTDVLPRQLIPSPPPPPPPPPILECSSSKEWKYAQENQSTEQNQTISHLISLRKIAIKSLSRSSSKHSITQDKINDNDSRPESSLSSSSLPVSTTSSDANFDNSKSSSSTTLSRKTSPSSSSTLKNSSLLTSKTAAAPIPKDPSSPPPPRTTKTSSIPTSTTNDSSSTTTKTSSISTSTTNDSSSATTKTSTTSKKTSSATSTPKPTINNSSPPSEPINPMITEDKKVKLTSDTDECLQESINSLKDKSSFNEQASENTTDEIKSDLAPLISREENITENDLPTKQRTRRRRHTTTSDESSQFRKLEFSVGDGVKWQEASLESLSSTDPIPSKKSSTVTTPRSSSPFPLINTKLAEQFSRHDNDDGRSSRTYQNMNDEEYFNQLRHEFCSQLDMRGSDEDALLNEHLLRILQDVRRPFNDEDVTMTDTKLRENETVHQLSIDTELFIHE